MRRLIAFLALCAGLSLPVFAAAPTDAGTRTGFPALFNAATGLANKLNGNGFASDTVYSPWGGSYTVDYGAWNGTSGSVRVTYNNYRLPMGWTFSGSWTYNGSIAPNGLLEGALGGHLTIDGINLGANVPGSMACDIATLFSGGYATLTLTTNLGGKPVALPAYRFSQLEVLDYLL